MAFLLHQVASTGEQTVDS